MNPQEIILLTKWVMAACPAQRFDEFTPDVWLELFVDSDPDEALAAAKSLARTHHFIAPADIIGEMQRTRIDEQQRSIAAKTHARALEAFEVPRAERLAIVAAARHDLDRALGKDPKTEAERRDEYAEARKVRCSYCHASVGQPCVQTAKAGVERPSPHPSRVDAALSLEAVS